MMTDEISFCLQAYSNGGSSLKEENNVAGSIHRAIIFGLCCCPQQAKGCPSMKSFLNLQAMTFFLFSVVKRSHFSAFSLLRRRNYIRRAGSFSLSETFRVVAQKNSLTAKEFLVSWNRTPTLMHWSSKTNGYHNVDEAIPGNNCMGLQTGLKYFFSPLVIPYHKNLRLW